MMKKEQVPNNPLTGPELRDFLLFRLEEAMAGHWVFNAGTSYPRVAFEMDVKLMFANPNMKEMKLVVKPGADDRIQQGLPLINPGEDPGALHVAIADQVENPNLARVHAGIPISVTKTKPAKPGEMFPTIEHHKVVYEKSGYPNLPPAKVEDRSEELAAKLGIPVAPREDYDVSDKEDLDAVGTEEE